MDEIQVIYNKEVLDKDFRIYGTNDDPLFLAKDVAEWIDYAKTSKGAYNVSAMLATVDEDEKLVSTILISGQNRQMWFLTEDGLYEVLMQSRKPIAKQFKKKVKEILKEIRRTGAYSSQNMSYAEMLLHSAQILVAQEKQLAEHEARLVSMEEKNAEIGTSIEKIKDKLEEKVYPYPDKKRRDKLRSRIYAHVKEYLDTYRQLGMADEFGDVVNLVHGQFMEDFKKDGVDLGKELEYAKQYYMQHYSKLRLARALSPEVLRPGKIRDLSIQSLISTSAAWTLKAINLLAEYNAHTEKVATAL